MSGNRVLAIILTVLGIGIAVAASIWLATQASAGMSAGAVVLGGLLAFIPIALLIGAGLYMFLRSGQQMQQESIMQKQRRLMDIVSSRGQVTVNDLALELNTPADSIKELVHQLVGLRVFSGYINWDDGTLYSVEADQLRSLEKCKNCGGALKLSGKGVVTCPFCGTEYFLR